MKKHLSIYMFVIVSMLSACVQKTTEQTLTFQLNVSEIPNIKTVGIELENEAIEWEKYYEMKPLVKDSLYELKITGHTGYLFTEVKFKINDETELKDQPNRKVIFDKSGNTIYKATFNKIN